MLQTRSKPVTVNYKTTGDTITVIGTMITTEHSDVWCYIMAYEYLCMELCSGKSYNYTDYKICMNKCLKGKQKKLRVA